MCTGIVLLPMKIEGWVKGGRRYGLYDRERRRAREWRHREIVRDGINPSETHVNPCEGMAHKRRRHSSKCVYVNDPCTARRAILGQNIVFKNMRIPEAVIADFDRGDSVEVWLSGGWWRGVVVGVDDFFSLLYFPYRSNGEQHSLYPNAQLRIHQKWHNSGKYTFWQYRKKNTDLSPNVTKQKKTLTQNLQQHPQIK
ncbi:hypothetical protein LXL04_008064 [Taraxacum kok-saghyz]